MTTIFAIGLILLLLASSAALALYQNAMDEKEMQEEPNKDSLTSKQNNIIK